VRFIVFYDMVVEIEAESEQKFKEIKFVRIRRLKHVRSTLTPVT
jgi:hypothetical protein